jgi:phosphoglycerate dehydrogenase-like enzyme
MKNLLCHEKSFARIAPHFKPFEAQICPYVINDAGEIFHALTGERTQTPDPAIIYGTTDTWFSRIFKQFVEVSLASPHLEWFQSSSAGVEHPSLHMLGDKADIFTNSRAQSSTIAEWVIWAALDWLQRGPARRDSQANGKWERHEFREISETRWLIYGFGHIGKAAADRVRGFGGHVTGVRRTPGPDGSADLIIHPKDTLEHLGNADIVLLASPLTPETAGVVNADFFAHMKENSALLNVGRGGLLDEAALIEGLALGRPVHAALDVFVQEPQPVDSPIYCHPQIVATPHLAANTKAAVRRTDALFLENLKRFLSGEEMINQISLGQG